jgi:isopenicillin N synthase-like dioxygenase
MAAKQVSEGGLEPAVAAPVTLLQDVLNEGLQAIKERGYAIIKLSPASKEAVDRLRRSQTQFFKSSREEKKKYVHCHPINTHGISEVNDLKYYFQARSGGRGSALPFPGPTADFAGDFGIDVTDVYAHLDLLGRACLMELAPTLKVELSSITKLLDPMGVHKQCMKKSSKDKVIALKITSHRDGEHVWSDLFLDDYVSSSNLDLFYYHNIEEMRQKWALNHPAHTDSGIISFIPVSTIPALDFFDQKLGVWVEIEKVVQEQAPALGDTYADYVIAMAGDTLEQLAKFTFKAGLHRVVRTEVPRESAVYKLRARPELVGPKYEVDYKVVQVQRKALGEPEL